MLSNLKFRATYDTYKSNPLTEFLIPCLESSTSYSRAVAYFSGALLACAQEAFTDFAERGGKYRLICSPNLTQSDAKFLIGYEAEKIIGDLNTQVGIHDHEGELGPALDLMSAMIRSGQMEIRLAIPKANSDALFHQKIGFFSDGTNSVSFQGSNNESLSAWWPGHNSERFQVFPDFLEGREDFCEEIVTDFEAMWRNEYPGFEIKDFSESLEFITGRETDRRSLLEIKKKVRSWYQKSTKEKQPSFALREYQELALENWIKAGHQGVISFATGAGKTITALDGIRRWFEGVDGSAAIILVPSVRLQKQWMEEILKFGAFSEVEVLPAGGLSGKSEWSPAIAGFTQKQATGKNRITVAVMQTASNPAFYNNVKWGSHLMVVADEMHNMGATTRLSFLEVLSAGAVLGLSATPTRFNEDENRQIRSVFGADLEPEIGIKQAQEIGALVHYTYSPIPVRLTPGEETKYAELSTEIAQLSARKKSSRLSASEEERLNNLRIWRADVLKGAANKDAATAEVILDNYKKAFSWLVFCNDQKQLNSIRRLSLPASPMTFHQEMDGDPDATLRHFSESGGVLLAIEMLDEGIDIPSIEGAILVASTQNPRQFIQRLGRVLRKNPKGFKQPVVFDFIVLGEDGFAINASEIRRARMLAKTAINSRVELQIDDWDKFAVDGENEI